MEQYTMSIDGSFDMVSARAGASVILVKGEKHGGSHIQGVFARELNDCPDILHAECQGLLFAVRMACSRFPAGRAHVTICTDRLDLLRIVELYWKPNQIAVEILDIMERHSPHIAWSIEKVERRDNWLADVVAVAARKGYNIPTVQAIQQFRRARRVTRQTEEQAS